MKQIRPITNREAAEETYHDVEALIWKYLLPHIKSGADVHELLSIAQEEFLTAYQSHDLQRGCFTTHLTWRLRAGVRRYWAERKKARRLLLYPDGLIPGSADAVQKQRSSFWEVVRHLPEDSQIIVNLVLQPPEKLKNRVQQLGGKPKHWRRAIGEALMETGWSYVRISEAVKSLFEVLSS